MTKELEVLALYITSLLVQTMAVHGWTEGMVSGYVATLWFVVSCYVGAHWFHLTDKKDKKRD